MVFERIPRPGKLLLTKCQPGRDTKLDSRDCTPETAQDKKTNMYSCQISSRNITGATWFASIYQSSEKIRKFCQ